MTKREAGNKKALALVTIVFFVWGFLTSLNDVLIPHLKSLFELNYAEVMLVQFTFFGAYFLVSMPSGRVLAKLGYQNSIVIGLLVSAIGAFLFYPAAAVPSFGFFLAAFFILASGITLLQVAANPYVGRLGIPRTASSRLNLAQAFNSLGTTLAPKLGGLVILSSTVLAASQLAEMRPPVRMAYKIHQALLVQGPYLGIGIALVVLAVTVWLFHLPKPSESASPEADVGQHFLAALRRPHLCLGVIAIFVYVGAEVSVGSFMINYISRPEIGNMSARHAANFVALYWGGAMLGRFIGSAVLQKVDPGRLLGSFAIVAAALIMITMLSTGAVAVWAIVCVGLFNSIMFPNIFTLGIQGMGHLTGAASSLLIMAIVGGAVIPLAQGVIADTIGIHHAFLLPLACYAYIMFYGFRGSKVDVTVPYAEGVNG